MRRAIRKAIAIIAIGTASILMTASVYAQEWPLVGEDYWEVTGIDVKDGGSWKYANWLATEWRKNLEFSKSQGWIKDYMIISNVHARSGEPDLYLIRVIEDIPSAKVDQKRYEEYMAWRKKSAEQMVDESGNRAEYREVMSNSLLQVFKFRE